MTDARKPANDRADVPPGSAAHLAASISPAGRGILQMWYIFFAFGVSGMLGLSLVARGEYLPTLPEAYRQGFGQAVTALALIAFIATLAVLHNFRQQAGGARAMQQAFIQTSLGLSLLSVLFCAFFADLFFDFPSPDAAKDAAEHFVGYEHHLWWGVNLASGSAGPRIPAELYMLVAILPVLSLSVYLVFNLFFVERYAVSDAAVAALPETDDPPLDRHGIALILFLFALSIVLHRSGFVDPVLRGGFPTHAFFLIAVLGIPSLWLNKKANAIVNWRALTLTCFAAVGAGIVWEATLGARIGWWVYDQETIIGIWLEAWSYLAVEAVALWLFISLPVVLVFETRRRMLLRAEEAEGLADAVRPSSVSGPLMVALLLSVLAGAAAFTLADAIDPQVAKGVYDFKPGATEPLAYTRSLVLFVLPTLLMVAWLFWKRSQEHIDAVTLKAFGIAGGILAVMGFLLDSLFGMIFFTFTNHGAVLGNCADTKPLAEASLLCLPAYNWTTGQWVAGIPVEEFLFYALGSIFVLAFYLWLCDYFMEAYNASPETRHADTQKIGSLLSVHRRGLYFALTLLVLAFVLHGVYGGEGIPGYAIFLIIGPGIPVILLYTSLSKFINWPAAFMVAFQVMILGMLWEASLGVPFGWWGYQPEQMMGIFVAEWGVLPIEAVALWFLVAFPTIFVFEAVRCVLYHERSWQELLLGRSNTSSTEA
jgi:hypothetical protein